LHKKKKLDWTIINLQMKFRVFYNTFKIKLSKVAIILIF